MKLPSNNSKQQSKPNIKRREDAVPYTVLHIPRFKDDLEDRIFSLIDELDALSRAQLVFQEGDQIADKRQQVNIARMVSTHVSELREHLERHFD